MKMKYLLLLAVLSAVVITSCKKDKNNDPSKETGIVGTWIMDSVRVVTTTNDGGASFTEKQHESFVGREDVVAVFKSDGSFTQNYKTDTTPVVTTGGYTLQGNDKLIFHPNSNSHNATGLFADTSVTFNYLIEGNKLELSRDDVSVKEQVTVEVKANAYYRRK